jgi:hypothetical protein
VDVDTTFYAKPQAVAASREVPPSAKPRESHMWAKGDEPSFHDVLDAINPLHQIPVVSALYENATGDRIGIVPRIIGGALFGGPIGMVAAIATGVFEDATGKTPGETVIAALTGDSDKDPGAPQTASLQTGSSPPPSSQQSGTSATRRGGKDADGSLPGLAAPASAPAPTPAMTTPAVLMAAMMSGGRDGDPTSSMGPVAAPSVPAEAAPSFVAEHQQTPRQAADQLASDAANQARFGKSSKPLFQQAGFQQAALQAAADGAGRSPTVAFGASNQKGVQASYAMPQAKPQQAGAPQPGLAPVVQAMPETLSDDHISKAMQTALDKYEQMVKQRQTAGGPPPGTQVDISQ